MARLSSPLEVEPSRRRRACTSPTRDYPPPSAGSLRPLLQLLLVPVHRQLELVELLPAQVQLRLQRGHFVVERHLLLLHLLGVVADAVDSEFGEAEHVLLRLELLRLRPGATLRELHLLVDVAKMLLHHGHAVRVFLRVALDVLQLTLLGADRRVERAVLGVGEGGRNVSWPSSSRSEPAVEGRGRRWGIRDTTRVRLNAAVAVGGGARTWVGQVAVGSPGASKRYENVAGLARGAPSNSLMMPDRARRRAPERARAVRRPSRWSRGRCHDAASAGRARRSDVWARGSRPACLTPARVAVAVPRPIWHPRRVSEAALERVGSFTPRGTRP